MNPALAAKDTVAPTLTESTKVELNIFHSNEGGCAQNSCDGVASINLTVAVVDDQSPPDRIGYRLAVVDGTVPPGVTLPSFDTVAFGNVISIPWNSESSGENFRFELSVAPIDEAGNVGDAQRVVVQRSDGGGCAIRPGRVGDPALPGAAIGVVIGTLVLRRRGRRSSR